MISYFNMHYNTECIRLCYITARIIVINYFFYETCVFLLILWIFLAWQVHHSCVNTTFLWEKIFLNRKLLYHSVVTPYPIYTCDTTVIVSHCITGYHEMKEKYCISLLLMIRLRNSSLILKPKYCYSGKFMIMIKVLFCFFFKREFLIAVKMR